VPFLPVQKLSEKYVTGSSDLLSFSSSQWWGQKEQILKPILCDSFRDVQRIKPRSLVLLHINFEKFSEKEVSLQSPNLVVIVPKTSQQVVVSSPQLTVNGL